MEAVQKKVIDAIAAAKNYDDFKRLREITLLVEQAVEERFIREIRERQARVPGLILEAHGLKARWGGELTPGCQSCLDGTGLSAIRSVSQCNLDCAFCYYHGQPKHLPLRANEFSFGGKDLNLEQLFMVLDKQGESMRSVSWVFFEPWTDIEKHYRPIEYIAKKGIHQHMYTNGLLCTPESLKKLADCGLQELRFNLAASNCAPRVLENMVLARKHFRYLCIESPMTQTFFSSFMEHKTRILETGVDHIHCAELHLNEQNIGNFPGEEFYLFRGAYFSPMSSRRLTYDLLDVAAGEGWKGVAINDCSNETKLYRSFPHQAPPGTNAWNSTYVPPQNWYILAILKNRLFTEGSDVQIPADHPLLA